MYSTTSKEQSQALMGKTCGGMNGSNFQNLSSVALTPSANAQLSPMNITCANNNYQVLGHSQSSSNGQGSYGNNSLMQQQRMNANSYTQPSTSHNYESQQQMPNGNSGYASSSTYGGSMPQMSIGNYQALNNVRQQQQQMASGNYQFSREAQPPHQPVAFQSQALTKQPLGVGQYYAQNSQGNGLSGQGGMGSRPGSNYADSVSKTEAANPSAMHAQGQGSSYSGNQTQNLAQLGSGNSRMNPYNSPSQYSQQYTSNSSAKSPQMSSSFNPHSPHNAHQQQMSSSQYNSSNYQQNQTQSNTSSTSSPPSVQTIRVGAPAPGQVLEPQTIRVQAPAPQPQSMETQMKIVLPKGMQLADPQMLAQMSAQMSMDMQQAGDSSYKDANSSVNNTDDGDPEGVKYIPLSWGELLGGGAGKDGLNGLKVIMAPPPAPDSPNQNRQLRVAFGNQAVSTQPGEVPLKVLSINPVEGYEMGPVNGLEGNATSEMEKHAAMMQQSNQQQQQSQQQYPNRTQSLTAPTPPQIPTASSARTTRGSPSSGRMPQAGYSSPTMYSSGGPNSNNAVAKRLDFAGTKFY